MLRKKPCQLKDNDGHTRYTAKSTCMPCTSGQPQHHAVESATVSA